MLMTSRRKRIIIVGTAIAALGAGGAAIATAAGDDEDGRPITGAALDKASAAALAHTGGGQVTGTEAGDEEGAYEVEVTRGDGSQVDVHLGSDFRVLGDAADSDADGDR
jgi:hypothetical protein